MRLDDLTMLTIQDLCNIRNKNLVFFNVIAIIDLVVFYLSLYQEQWIMLFISFGVFIASLSLYDNYRIANDIIQTRQSVA